MSIKSAGILHELIFNSKELVITPLLEPQKQLHEGSASVDLRLGTRFIASRRGSLTHIDTNWKDFDLKNANLQDSYYVNFGKCFVLHPGHFVLASTLEYLHLPSNLAGNVVTRSSWGRHGLVIATAIGVHPGYMGVLTLELRNLAEIPLMLYPGRRILQVFFYEVQITPAEAKSFDKSAYLGSTKPTVGNFRSEETEIITIENFTKYEKFPFLPQTVNNSKTK